MKNAMKKLMTLALVAVMLISAIPFQASAAGGYFTLTTVGDCTRWNEDELFIMGDTVQDMINIYIASELDSSKEVTLKSWYYAPGAKRGSEVNGSKVVEEGSRLVVRVTYKQQETPTTAPSTEAPTTEAPTTEAPTTEAPTTTPVVKNPVKVVFKNEDSSVIKTIAKWDLRYDNTAADQLLYYAKKNYGLDSAYEFGKNSDGASVWVKHEGKTRGEYIGVSDYLIVPGDEVHIVLKKDTTPESVPAETLTPAKPNFGKYDQFEVYLHVYLNGNISEPHKNINITDPFALDGTISIKEVEKVIATYYGAKTIAGIDIDGIYFSTRNWTKDFILDQNKFTKLVDLDEWVLGQRVDLNVMINNAYVKSASTNTADTSNPKTGDNIFMTVSVMGLSATALAAAFFFSKKRAVR